MRRVAPEARDRPAAPIVYFGHGTTVATNALIQHRGVKTGLVTTDGFRDLLEIGRQKRPDLYDIQADKPLTLVPRDLRLEVPERLRHTGEVDVPLDEAKMRAAARTLKAAGVKAVAVSFLYGFIRPDHEKRAVEDPARGDARRLHLGRPRDRAGVPRVRAAVDGGAERLSRPGDGELHPAAEPAARSARHDGHAASHAVQRRRHRLCDGGRDAGAHRALRPVDRRGRRPGDRPAGGLRGPHHLRHGRHLDRRGAAAGRPLPARRRGHGARLSHQGADARHPHGRRGRRLDRLHRQRRPAEGGPALGRRRSRSGLLRQGQSRSPPSPTPTSCCRR